MRIKSIIQFAIGMILFLFIGIKYDPEFNEPTFFIKHKPNLKMEYYSPIGESDLTLNDLSGIRKEEEIAYREFVKNREDHGFLDNLSFFIIPLISLLILTSLAQLVGIIHQNRKYNGLVISYLSNLFLLFFAFIVYWNLSVNGLLIIVMYWILCLLSIVWINGKMRTEWKSENDKLGSIE